MNEAFELSVAKDFSKFPAGRFTGDGPFPGEKFRAQLAAALEKYQGVTVLLDGTVGYGSSFLEEAFGGLVRVHGWTAEKLRSKLRIVSSDQSLEKEVWFYIDDAKPQRP